MHEMTTHYKNETARCLKMIDECMFVFYKKTCRKADNMNDEQKLRTTNNGNNIQK